MATFDKKGNLIAGNAGSLNMPPIVNFGNSGLSGLTLGSGGQIDKPVAGVGGLPKVDNKLTYNLANTPVPVAPVVQPPIAPLVQKPVSSVNIKPNPPAILPVKTEVIENPQGVVAGTNTEANMIAQQIANREAEVRAEAERRAAEDQDPMKDLQKMLSQYEAPSSQAQDYASMFGAVSPQDLQTARDDARARELAYNSARNEFNTIQAQLNAISAREQAALLQLQEDAKGRGITAGGLAPFQSATSRQAAIESLSLAPLLYAAQVKMSQAQGDYESAKNYLTDSLNRATTYFGYVMKDQEAQRNFRNDMVDKIYNFADKQTQRQLEEQKTKNAQDFTTQTNNLNYAQGIATEALKNGQSDIYKQIIALNPADPDYMARVGALGEQITVQPKETTDITEYNLAKSQGYKGTLLDWQTRQANLRAIVPKSTSETRDTSISQFLQSKKGTDGFVAAGDYQEALRKFIAQGGNQTNFFASYPQQSYLRQQEIDKLPAAMKPQLVTSKGDLTENQMSIINDAKSRLDVAKKRFENVTSIRNSIIQQSIQQYGFDPSLYL